MFVRLVAGAFICAAFLAAPAYAQVNDDVIVVTGSRIATDEGVVALQQDLPYVSISVPADFVIFTLTLESASRSIDERGKELAQTFQTLAGRVARARGIIMEVGQPGSSAPLETAAAREAVEQDEEDWERSVIRVVLKFAVQEGDTFASVRQRAEAFIDDTDASGRVELVTGDDQYIGISDPRKHRETLLRQIAEDTRLIQSIFGVGGTAPAIGLTGLEGRVKTRPIGPLELEMYIPYSVTLQSGRPEQGAN